jgi:hypothetical protein
MISTGGGVSLCKITEEDGLVSHTAAVYSRKEVGSLVLGMAACLELICGLAQAQPQKPNILVIMGDDIGLWNISAWNHGMLGFRTPNIDRIAHEGALFTTYYGQQSCTAGRAAFITGKAPSACRPLPAGPGSSHLGLP